MLSWTVNVREQATPKYGHNEHNIHVAAYMVIESVWCICWFCLTSVESNTSTYACITFTISFWCIILNWFTGMFSHTCYYTEIILLVLKSAWYSSADNLGEFAFSLYTKIIVWFIIVYLQVWYWAIPIQEYSMWVIPVTAHMDPDYTNSLHWERGSVPVVSSAYV